jgi:hypothetical protein
MDDLLKYHSISANHHAQNMLDMSNKPNRIRDIMIDLSRLRGDSMLISAMRMTNDKTTAMRNHILDGKVIVVNMAGGWCFWDDKEMTEITFDDFMDTVVDVSHDHFNDHKELKYVMSYKWPDVPKNVKYGIIIKLYEKEESESPIYLKSIENGWELICTKCISNESKILHSTQMTRKKQLSLLDI